MRINKDTNIRHVTVLDDCILHKDPELLKKSISECKNEHDLMYVDFLNITYEIRNDNVYCDLYEDLKHYRNTIICHVCPIYYECMFNRLVFNKQK